MIIADDIQFRASEKNDDTDMGGGLLTATVIEDGAVGQLFPPVSDVNRTAGNLSLRKAFAGIFNDTTDTYYGAYALISKQPTDPAVTATLSSKGEWSDHRSDAIEVLESYLIPGAISNYVVFNKQIVGSRSIRLLGESTSTTPSIGKTYLLVENEGLTEEYYQYVKFTNVTVQSQIFNFDNNQSKTYKVYTVTLALPLEYTFAGNEATLNLTATNTILRNTVATDASHYYGITTLKTEAEINDATITVDSIFTQLIPTNTTEKSIPNETLTSNTLPIQSSSTITLTINANYGGTNTLYLDQGIFPDSLSITINNVTWTDKGTKLIRSSSEVGSVDYNNGIITFNDSISHNGNATITFIAGGIAARYPITATQDVTDITRGYTWQYTFDLPVARGSAHIYYRSYNDWYHLIDDYDGNLYGVIDNSGVGYIDYENGFIQLTTAALPDLDTQIIYQCCDFTQTFNQSYSTITFTPYTFTLAHAPKKRTFELTYLINDVEYTAADSDNDIGELKTSGVVIGYVYQKTLTIIKTLDSGSDLSVAYDYDADRDIYKTISFNTDSNSEIHETLPLGEGVTGSVGDLEIICSDIYNSNSYFIQLPYQGTATGWLLNSFYSVDHDSVVDDISINYSTNELDLKINSHVQVFYNPGNGWYETKTTTSTYINKEVTIYYIIPSENINNVATTEDFTVPITVGGYLASENITELTDKSLYFKFNNKYIFNESGNLYYKSSFNTNTKIALGTIDNETKAFTLTTYTAGEFFSNAQLIASLTKNVVPQQINLFSYITANYPIKSASLTLHYKIINEDGISVYKQVTANSEGVISGTNISGAVNYNTGLITVTYSNDDCLLAESVYLDYITVDNLTISQEIIGIDSIRLPTNGQVPIIRDGELILIHNEVTTELTDIVENTPFQLPAVRLESCYVIDNDSAVIDTQLYSVNKVSGTVTVLNLTGLSLPLSAVHRITDLSFVTDAQINGQLALNKPITHDYPVGAYISSCLYLGNRQAVIYDVWAESTWVNDWSEVLHGTEPLFDFDNTHFPITTTNEGAEDDHVACIFTNSTEYKVISRNRGQIASGNTSTDNEILNPAGGVFLSIPHLGWGNGWSTGNVLRIIIHAAHIPLWIARTVMPSDISETTHAICCELRGNVVIED